MTHRLNRLVAVACERAQTPPHTPYGLGQHPFYICLNCLPCPGGWGEGADTPSSSSEGHTERGKDGEHKSSRFNHLQEN